MHVLEILRGLATGGRAVLTTIHQVQGLRHVLHAALPSRKQSDVPSMGVGRT